MNVTLICNSDLHGGAAVVTTRLMHALRASGVNARMLVFSKHGDDPQTAFVSSQSLRVLRFLKERVGIYMRNGFSRERLFQVSTADSGCNIARHPWVKDADVVVLSWINQGMLSLNGIRRLCATGKPVVWMMHDMWCFTGICHHAYQCTRYRQECGCCPFLDSSNPHDLSYRTFLRKKRLYNDSNIHFVAVSNWLAECARSSTLLRDARISVIPNAFPVSSFHTQPQSRLRLMAIDYDKRLIVMGAARLDDPIKGLDYAIDALNILFEEHPELTHDTMAVFFGNVADRSKFDRLYFPHMLYGTLSDPQVIRELYAQAAVVISTSLYETLPGTLIEGQAAGAVPVTFGRGGQGDIVDHLRSGYIAEYRNPRSVAEGILWALGAGIDREMLHRQVEERFAADSVARRYIDLFNSLLHNQKV